MITCTIPVIDMIPLICGEWVRINFGMRFSFPQCFFLCNSHVYVITHNTHFYPVHQKFGSFKKFFIENHEGIDIALRILQRPVVLCSTTDDPRLWSWPRGRLPLVVTPPRICRWSWMLMLWMMGMQMRMVGGRCDGESRRGTSGFAVCTGWFLYWDCLDSTLYRLFYVRAHADSHVYREAPRIQTPLWRWRWWHLVTIYIKSQLTISFEYFVS